MDEITYESIDEIMNKLVELEKGLIVLRHQEFELSKPLQEVRYKITQVKSEISILNKQYWQTRG